MQVCLFDIDGTLLNSGGAGKAAIEAALVEDFGVELHTHVTYSGRTDRAIGRDLLQFHHIEVSPAHWQRLRGGYLARLPAALTKFNGAVLPGIANLLAWLSQCEDIAVGLLTGNIRDVRQSEVGPFRPVGPFRLWRLWRRAFRP